MNTDATPKGPLSMRAQETPEIQRGGSSDPQPEALRATAPAGSMDDPRPGTSAPERSPRDIRDLEPLESTEAVRERVAAMVGAGAARQLWIMFTDRKRRQFPLVVPLEDFPALPESSEVEKLVAICGMLLEENCPGGSVFFVLERPGTGRTTTQDRQWAGALDYQLAKEDINNSGVYLATPRGVATLSPNGFRPDEPGRAR